MIDEKEEELYVLSEQAEKQLELQNELTKTQQQLEEAKEELEETAQQFDANLRGKDEEIHALQQQLQLAIADCARDTTDSVLGAQLDLQKQIEVSL